MSVTAGIKAFPYLSKIAASPTKLLFCFHHAGGSASVFYRYIKQYSDIAMIPVELPAHGSRINEAPVTDWHELTTLLCSDITNVLKEYDVPFSMLGCSLGSLIAFECAVKLNEYGKKADELIICSHSSPDVLSPGYKTSMGYDRLIDEINLLSGTPDSVTGSKEMIDFYLPLIYNDYLLHDNYKYSGQVLDRTDLYAFCGTNDPYFDRNNMKNWKNMSEGSCHYSEYTGGHFFLYDADNLHKVVKSAGI